MSHKCPKHDNKDDCNAELINKCYAGIVMALVDSQVTAAAGIDMPTRFLVKIARELLETEDACKAIETLLNTLKPLIPAAVASAAVAGMTKN